MSRLSLFAVMMIGGVTGAGLESQAENGDPSKLAASVKEAKGVVASGVFNTPVGDDKPGPALPGKGLSLHLRGQPRR